MFSLWLSIRFSPQFESDLPFRFAPPVVLVTSGPLALDLAFGSRPKNSFLTRLLNRVPQPIRTFYRWYAAVIVILWFFTAVPMATAWLFKFG